MPTTPETLSGLAPMNCWLPPEPEGSGLAFQLLRLASEAPCSPEEARQFFVDFHASQDTEKDIVDRLGLRLHRIRPPMSPLEKVTALFDRLLGLDIMATELDLADQTPVLLEQHPSEQLWLPREKTLSPATFNMLWTDYDVLRGVVKYLELGADDVVYDLGAGYGRLPLYAGLTTEATCKGIELVRPRIQAATEAAARLGLTNVTFIEGNVLEQDITDGTVFYMYVPFSQKTFEGVAEQLRRVAEHKPIKIALLGFCRTIRDQPWLEPVPVIDPEAEPQEVLKKNISFLQSRC